MGAQDALSPTLPTPRQRPSRQPPIGGDRVGPEQEMAFYWCGAVAGCGKTGEVTEPIDGGPPPGNNSKISMNLLN